MRQADAAAAEVVNEQKPPVPVASQSAEREKPVMSAENALAASGSAGQVPSPSSPSRSGPPPASWVMAEGTPTG